VVPAVTKKAASFSLQGSNNVATLDYGREVAGYPYFVVSSLSKPVQLELKYTEPYDGLNHVNGDGPFYFASALSNTFRVETFNVTAAGRYQSYFIQGGQRWESITLLTEGSVTFSDAGLVATIDPVDLNNLPSQFNCSNDLYNSIWKLGAGAASAACVDAGSQSATWDITAEGAYIRGQKPGISALSSAFTNYTLSFETKIARGGTGWSVARNPTGTGYSLLLISNLPNATTFVNTNKTLTPPNTIVVSFGYGPLNQTTLPSFHLDNFPVPFDVLENKWYQIETSLNYKHLAVSIAGTQVFNVSLAKYTFEIAAGASFGGPMPSTGSFGFGPHQDQAALFSNVTVRAANNTQIYSNSLTSTDVLAEYGVGKNVETVCMDGAKRDRTVWLGDLFHTTRIIPASLSRSDYVTGTLRYLLDWQNFLGLIPIDPPLGYSATYSNQVGVYFGLQDYQILGLLAFTGYFDRTNDLTFAAEVFPAIQQQIAFLLSQVDSTTQLINIGGFLGPAFGSAVSGAFVEALHGAATVATALGNSTLALQYSNAASATAAGINAHLWNPTLGIYGISNSSLSDFSVAGLSFAITSGAASPHRATRALSALTNLTLSPGYKDSTRVNSSDRTANISPNTNGFLLSAAMMSNDTAPVKYLLDNLWAAMVTQNLYSTGASWEYVGQNLTPGLSLFTSLSHPWGGAPTYILPEYISGLRAATPGYKTWLVVPAYQGFGLAHAAASVETPSGQLSTSWQLSGRGRVLTVHVNAPAGTSGSLQLPGDRMIMKAVVNGKKSMSGSAIPLGGGVSTIVMRL